MTDSESVNPFEAPRQLTVSSDPALGGPMRYEATPTIDDLNAALRPVSVFIMPSLLLLLLSLPFLGGLISVIIKGPDIELVGLLAFVCLILPIVFLLYKRIQAAKTHLRSNPNATASLIGELTSEGFQLKSEHRVSWLAHDGLVFCKVRNNQISLCYDPQGTAVKVLPMRGFQNPGQAIRFLEFQADKFPEVDMLQPLSAPSMVGEQPADAITFGGLMKAADLKPSPLEAIRKRHVKRLLTVAFVSFAIVLTAVAFIFSLQVTLVAAASILIVSCLTIYKIRSAAHSTDPDLPLIAIQGWLNGQEIALLHNIGQSRSGWHDFRSVGFNEECIWLHVYGGQNRFVLLPRRFFANEAQWQWQLT